MSEKLIKKKEDWKYKSFFLILILIFSIPIIFLLNTDIIPFNNEDENNNVVEDFEKEISVSLKIISSENEKKYKLDNISEESTVFDILKESIEIEYNNNYSYGVFVESINGIKNGDDGKYWQYYINNTLGDVAADKKILKEGDNVEWRFEKVPF
ncbi:MAG: DUF4430 domain-containing protein [Candidatus Pacebacteria bacterium]|nr:DUF4430 domain-containing protein [Candidatus Paceibacterota bacterium]